MPEQIEAHTPIHLGIALMMFIYALAILVIGLWAYGILPAGCTNSQLRLSLRALIVMGAVMLTMYVGYALCFERCETHTPNENVIPTMILIFNIAMSLGCTVSLGLALTQFNQDDTCKTAPSFDNCKLMITLMLVISAISLVVYIGVFSYFNVKSAKKGSQLKEAAGQLYQKQYETLRKQAEQQGNANNTRDILNVVNQQQKENEELNKKLSRQNEELKSSLEQLRQQSRQQSRRQSEDLGRSGSSQDVSQSDGNPFGSEPEPQLLQNAYYNSGNSNSNQDVWG